MNPPPSKRPKVLGQQGASNNNVNVCRDFLRNVCSRGSKCKFSHVIDSNDAENSLQDSVVFCHDYLNRGECGRNHCRFLHGSKEDEHEYNRSGYLAPHLKDQILRKGVAPDLPAHFGVAPICKDYLKGECHRSNCKFRHLTSKQYDLELSRCLGDGYHNSGGNGRMDNGYGDRNEYMFERKSDPMFARHSEMHDGKPKNGSTDPVGPELDLLRQENVMLNQRIQELEKQVQTLTITNEFLLDQNAQLRMGVKVTTTAVPAVPAVVSMSVQPAASLPPATMSMAPDQSIRISGAPVATLPPQNATITMATLEQPPNASISMSTLDASSMAAPPPPPATASIALPQSIPSGVSVMSCCHGQEITPAHVPPQQQPPSATGTAMHVQETRLVTFPITSLRQAM